MFKFFKMEVINSVQVVINVWNRFFFFVDFDICFG